jgi:hypothetical protein
MVREDVMLNILSRLPPKSLTRYNCVSEVWLALIENPDFFSKNLLNHSIFATTKSPGPPDPAFNSVKSSPPKRRMVPEDVMLNILSCLPPKSLTRFKCVSEVWLTLIENPDFFSNNPSTTPFSQPPNPQDPPDPAFILFKATQKSNIGNETYSFLSYHTLRCVSQSTLNLPEATPINLPPELPYHRLNIVASSSFHGLLRLHDIFVKMNIYLWNPLIPSKLNPLPYVPPDSLLNAFSYTVRARFNPRSNDFKVIRVFRVLHYSLSPTTYKVDVYSVRSGSWRQLHADLDNMFDNIHYHKGTTTYVNE